jgi:hypothetical protein
MYVRSAPIRAPTPCNGEQTRELDCDDDSGPNASSEVEFEADQEGVYFIFVDGFEGSGRFQLEIGPCGE